MTLFCAAKFIMYLINVITLYKASDYSSEILVFHYGVEFPGITVFLCNIIYPRYHFLPLLKIIQDSVKDF